MRICKMCGQELSESDFYTHKRYTKAGELKIDYLAICKHCHNLRSKDPEEVDRRARLRRDFEKTPEGKYRKLKNTRRKYDEFEVSLDKFLELLDQNCCYCGKSRPEGTLSTKDIDKSFTDDNVVPVCKSCNLRKARMRDCPDKFLKRTSRLYGITPEQKEDQEKLIGERFGRLLVTSIANRPKSAGRLYYTCLCDCGKTKDVREDVLKNGTTRSCGCYRKEYMSNRFNEEYESLVVDDDIGILNSTNKTIYEKELDKIRWSAKGRGIEFNITLQEFEELYKNNCHYCGTEECSSLDRIDSSNGYTVDNVVKCCKICNSMKNTLTQEEFYKHIIRMYKYIQKD